MRIEKDTQLIAVPSVGTRGGIYLPFIEAASALSPGESLVVSEAGDDANKLRSRFSSHLSQYARENGRRYVTRVMECPAPGEVAFRVWRLPDPEQAQPVPTTPADVRKEQVA